MVNQSNINRDLAIDLLERARIMTAIDPHGAIILVHKARELYPVSRETVLMIELLAYPNDRNHAMLMNLRARESGERKHNKNRVYAAVQSHNARKSAKGK